MRFGVTCPHSSGFFCLISCPHPVLRLSPLRWVRAVRRLSLCSSMRTRVWSSFWTGTWWREATRWSISTPWPMPPPWGSDQTTCCASSGRRDTNPSWRTSSRTKTWTRVACGDHTRIWTGLEEDPQRLQPKTRWTLKTECRKSLIRTWRPKTLWHIMIESSDFKLNRTIFTSSSCHGPSALLWLVVNVNSDSVTFIV